MKRKCHHVLSADGLMIHPASLETTLNTSSVKPILKPSIINDDIIVNIGLCLKKMNGNIVL
jgi:hypothetical protein